jgi:hypothetical protein
VLHRLFNFYGRFSCYAEFTRRDFVSRSWIWLIPLISRSVGCTWLEIWGNRLIYWRNTSLDAMNSSYFYTYRYSSLCSHKLNDNISTNRWSVPSRRSVSTWKYSVDVYCDRTGSISAQGWLIKGWTWDFSIARKLGVTSRSHTWRIVTLHCSWWVFLCCSLAAMSSFPYQIQCPSNE